MRFNKKITLQKRSFCKKVLSTFSKVVGVDKVHGLKKGGGVLQIKTLFKKDVFRELKGVVKASETTPEEKAQELSEYVVTKELERHLLSFFSAYTASFQKDSDKIGVWISGFFGSGKSHLLKMLACLLSGEPISGLDPAACFQEKIENPALQELLSQAAGQKADTILFNIDAKAAETGRDKDSIVTVFMRVFNEKMGYSSRLLWLANMERYLDQRGVYTVFQQAYERRSGKPWQEGRDNFYFEQDHVAAALTEAAGISLETARHWLTKGEASFSLTIEQFAQKVREYLDSQEPGHHIVFLCDEMGQYINGNGERMLNLQTVAETLSVACKGQAWIIATGQEDIDMVARANRDAFSKIIGRFQTRIVLSSANVEEVIKKRLLKKTDKGRDYLKKLYEEKKKSLLEMLFFALEKGTLRIYQNAEEFASCYPFVPYQADLLQQVFNGIRTHGAAGKHLSQGERSLLSAYQEVAKAYGDREPGTLIPFSAFFPAIETYLDFNIQAVFERARQSNLTAFDSSVLQTLFLLKYIKKQVPPVLENIATLLISHIEQKKSGLVREIKQSLQSLESLGFIEQNGREYLFLSANEQEDSQEIQQIQIPQKEVLQRAGQQLFTKIYHDPKVSVDGNYSYAYRTWLDEEEFGVKKGDISLYVITPLAGYDSNQCKSLSKRLRCVVLRLSADTQFYDEMARAMQIDQFITQKDKEALSPEVQVNMIWKGQESIERKERSLQLLKDSIQYGEFYCNGTLLYVRSQEPAERIREALRILAQEVYGKRQYISKFCSTEQSLLSLLTYWEKIARNGNKNTTEGAPYSNPKAEQEIYGLIDRCAYNKQPAIMGVIMDTFSRPPYGWNILDIGAATLSLFGRKTILFKQAEEYQEQTNFLTKQDYISFVTKPSYFDQVSLYPRRKVSQPQVEAARLLATRAFGDTNCPDDEDMLMERLKELCHRELYEKETAEGEGISITHLLSQYGVQPYPGKDALEKAQDILKLLLKIKDIELFYQYIYEKQEDILDYHEDSLDICKFFMEQKTAFDQALKAYHMFEANQAFLLQPEVIETANTIREILNYPSPYSYIHRLPELTLQFRRQFTESFHQECIPIRQDIEEDYQEVKNTLENSSLPVTVKEDILSEFLLLRRQADHVSNIYEIIAMHTQSDRLKIKLMERIFEEEASLEELQKNGEHPEKAVEVILSVKKLLGGSQILRSEEDIRILLEMLEKKLEEKLKENTIIKLI